MLLPDKPFYHGLIAGKFYPPHLGHLYLIRTAKAACTALTVFVVYKPGESPSLRQRIQWLERLVPGPTYLPVLDIETDDTKPESSLAWATYTVDLLETNKSFSFNGKMNYVCPVFPDVIFSSETYGESWAFRMGVEHVMVDRSRTAYPISGTQVRQNPYDNWEYLPPPVRGFYAKRVAIVGPESSGKTTLAKNLASHFDTVWVPEYGRLYVEGKGSLEATDHRIIFPLILQEQPRMEDELAEQANKVLICDTELITTKLWYQLWQAGHDNDAIASGLEQAIKERRYDLYLLSVPEGTGWVNDGFRDQPGTREWFAAEFRRLVPQYGYKMVELSGDWNERFYTANETINDLFYPNYL